MKALIVLVDALSFPHAQAELSAAKGVGISAAKAGRRVTVEPLHAGGHQLVAFGPSG